ncbi:MAG TPA: cupin domain-containing protein [Thermoanaerobaculia bacterium]|nr:cupin domain-containing protein [Thermoanaerobaculia bacterium]
MRAYSLENPNSLIEPADLERHGVLSWHVSSNDAERDATVAAIKREHRYVDQDVVELSQETPNLDAVCAKFDKEHYHTEDEVRFVLEGDGIFDVRDDADQWIRIEVTEGDIILIPAHKHHRFYLTDRKRIRCMRLFANHEGWAPLYRAES